RRGQSAILASQSQCQFPIMRTFAAGTIESRREREHISLFGHPKKKALENDHKVLRLRFQHARRTPATTLPVRACARRVTAQGLGTVHA
ncbi:hypothetical protein JI667_21390, partial [Bacillus sp. NTK074B]|uniref:hypothetical protein n=1 Tax=Bacillus sp. NTK074B TaxID=2802174 RepID=UPI001A903977|nr:hypothetical protein [Bacillus sp. NTK074B]